MAGSAGDSNQNGRRDEKGEGKPASDGGGREAGEQGARQGQGPRSPRVSGGGKAQGRGQKLDSTEQSHGQARQDQKDPSSEQMMTPKAQRTGGTGQAKRKQLMDEEDGESAASQRDGKAMIGRNSSVKERQLKRKVPSLRISSTGRVGEGTVPTKDRRLKPSMTTKLKRNEGLAAARGEKRASESLLDVDEQHVEGSHADKNEADSVYKSNGSSGELREELNVSDDTPARKQEPAEADKGDQGVFSETLPPFEQPKDLSTTKPKDSGNNGRLGVSTRSSPEPKEEEEPIEERSRRLIDQSKLTLARAEQITLQRKDPLASAKEYQSVQQKLQTIFKLGLKRAGKKKDGSDSDSTDGAGRKDTSDEAQRALAQVELELLKKIQQQCGEAEPIYQLKHKYAEGSDSPAWRKRAFNNQTLKKSKSKERIAEAGEKSEGSSSSEDGSQSEAMPGDNASEESDSKAAEIGEGGVAPKPKVKNNKIQEKLQKVGCNIPMTTNRAIKGEKWPQFRYQIYDAYRPQNLAQTRDYLKFLTQSRDNQEANLSENNAPEHMIDYLKQDLDTRFPNYINQNKILAFDQNFESGNIDSVYVHNTEEYNILMKVDTNTRGNSYWFYFKVTNFRVGQRYSFNVYNFTRSMDKFYQQGMNVLTKAESEDNRMNSARSKRQKDRKNAKKRAKKRQDHSKERAEQVEVEEAAHAGDFDDEKIEGITMAGLSLDNNSNSSGGSFENIGGSRAGKDDLKMEDENERQSTGGHSDEDIDEFEQDFFHEKWRINTCENILFESSEIPRYGNAPLSGNRPSRMELDAYNCQYYQKLSFQYRFKDEDRGKSVYFAYAEPYTYTELEHDLQSAKMAVLQKRKKYHKNGDAANENTEDELDEPIWKVINKKDLLINEQKKQNAGGSPAKTRSLNPLRSKRDREGSQPGQQYSQKKTQYDLQHEQIKKHAERQLAEKQNKFESQILGDQNEAKKINLGLIYEQSEPTQIKEARNFEVINSYLHYRQEILAQSMGGLNIYQVTMTKRREAGSIKHKKKKIIYIQARLHAAETHGSFIMRYVLKELTQNYLKYDELLHNNIVKLIPMVNPDGVVIGNARSSLAGVDLNRRWGNPNATIHPELYFLKKNIKATQGQSAGIRIFCDLHGHNRQFNCFFYGSNKAPDEGLLSWTKTRLLPKIFGQLEPIFDFNMCKFSTEKTKYNTARVVMWNEFKVANSFTLETSMFGRRKNKDSNLQKSYLRRGDITQLEQADFRSIAENLLQSFRQYVMLEPLLEEEFKHTGGWLKKKKLDEFAGVSNAKKKASDVGHGSVGAAGGRTDKQQSSGSQMASQQKQPRASKGAMASSSRETRPKRTRSSDLGGELMSTSLQKKVPSQAQPASVRQVLADAADSRHTSPSNRRLHEDDENAGGNSGAATTSAAVGSPPGCLVPPTARKPLSKTRTEKLDSQIASVAAGVAEQHSQVLEVSEPAASVDASKDQTIGRRGTSGTAQRTRNPGRGELAERTSRSTRRLEVGGESMHLEDASSRHRRMRSRKNLEDDDRAQDAKKAATAGQGAHSIEQRPHLPQKPVDKLAGLDQQAQPSGASDVNATTESAITEQAPSISVPRQQRARQNQTGKDGVSQGAQQLARNAPSKIDVMASDVPVSSQPGVQFGPGFGVGGTAIKSRKAQIEKRRTHSMKNKPSEENAKRAKKDVEATKKPEKKAAGPNVEEGEMLACLAQYFSKAEFQEAINDAVQSTKQQTEMTTVSTRRGKKSQQAKKVEENDDSGSDSQPSCDNMDQSEMKQIFQEALSDDDMQECFAAEDAASVDQRNSDLNVVIEESCEHQDKIEDYRAIEQKVIDAKAETAQLTEKFEKLLREINKKIKVAKVEKGRIGQILQTPTPFRGGWSEIPGQAPGATILSTRTGSTSVSSHGDLFLLGSQVEDRSRGPMIVSGQGQGVNHQTRGPKAHSQAMSAAPKSGEPGLINPNTIGNQGLHPQHGGRPQSKLRTGPVHGEDGPQRQRSPSGPAGSGNRNVEDGRDSQRSPRTRTTGRMPQYSHSQVTHQYQPGTVDPAWPRYSPQSRQMKAAGAAEGHNLAEAVPGGASGNALPLVNPQRSRYHTQTNFAPAAAGTGNPQRVADSWRSGSFTEQRGGAVRHGGGPAPTTQPPQRQTAGADVQESLPSSSEDPALAPKNALASSDSNYEFRLQEKLIAQMNSQQMRRARVSELLQDGPFFRTQLQNARPSASQRYQQFPGHPRKASEHTAALRVQATRAEMPAAADQQAHGHQSQAGATLGPPGKTVLGASDGASDKLFRFLDGQQAAPSKHKQPIHKSIHLVATGSPLHDCKPGSLGLPEPPQGSSRQVALPAASSLKSSGGKTNSNIQDAETSLHHGREGPRAPVLQSLKAPHSSSLKTEPNAVDDSISAAPMSFERTGPGSFRPTQNAIRIQKRVIKFKDGANSPHGRRAEDRERTTAQYQHSASEEKGKELSELASSMATGAYELKQYTHRAQRTSDGATATEPAEDLDPKDNAGEQYFQQRPFFEPEMSTSPMNSLQKSSYIAAKTGHNNTADRFFRLHDGIGANGIIFSQNEITFSHRNQPAPGKNRAKSKRHEPRGGQPVAQAELNQKDPRAAAQGAQYSAAVDGRKDEQSSGELGRQQDMNTAVGGMAVGKKPLRQVTRHASVPAEGPQANGQTTNGGQYQHRHPLPLSPMALHDPPHPSPIGVSPSGIYHHKGLIQSMHFIPQELKKNSGAAEHQKYMSISQGIDTLHHLNQSSYSAKQQQYNHGATNYNNANAIARLNQDGDQEESMHLSSFASQVAIETPTQKGLGAQSFKQQGVPGGGHGHHEGLYYHHNSMSPQMNRIVGHRSVVHRESERKFSIMAGQSQNLESIKKMQKPMMKGQSRTKRPIAVFKLQDIIMSDNSAAFPNVDGGGDRKKSVPDTDCQLGSPVHSQFMMNRTSYPTQTPTQVHGIKSPFSFQIKGKEHFMKTVNATSPTTHLFPTSSSQETELLLSQNNPFQQVFSSGYDRQQQTFGPATTKNYPQANKNPPNNRIRAYVGPKDSTQQLEATAMANGGRAIMGCGITGTNTERPQAPRMQQNPRRKVSQNRILAEQQQYYHHQQHQQEAQIRRSPNNEESGGGQLGPREQRR